MEKAALAVGSSILSISAGGGLPVPYREGRDVRRPRGLLQTVGRHAAPAGHAVRPRDFAGDRAGPLPGRRERLPDQRNPRDQDGWREHVLSARRRLQQPGPADSLRRVPPDGDLPRRRRAGPSAAERATSSSAARLCESGDIFTQEEGGFVARRALPDGQGRRLSGHRQRRRLRLRHGQQLQLEAARGRVLIENGKPHLVRRRQTLR